MNNFKDKLQKLEEAIGFHQVIYFGHRTGISARMIDQVVEWVMNEDGDGNSYMTVESMWVLGRQTLVVFPMGGINAPGKKQFIKELKLYLGFVEVRPEGIL